jgi:hypothetical protein
MALSYISEGIIVRSDIPSYLALQRAIDCVWAAEARRLMKKGLQRVQAAAFRRELCEGMDVFTKEFGPKVTRNPSFLALFDLSLLGILYDNANVVTESKDRAPLLNFIRAYATDRKRKFSKTATYPLLCYDRAIRGHPCVELHDDGSEEYFLLRGVEYHSRLAGGREETERFDFAFVKRHSPAIPGVKDKKRGVTVLLFMKDAAHGPGAIFVNKTNCGEFTAEDIPDDGARGV